MTEEEAKSSGLNNTLWNCIGGGGAGVCPDVYHATLQPGDELLLCSDGLTRKLTDAQIFGILKGADTSEIAVAALVTAANEAGGEDNITAVVARMLPTPQTDTTPVDDMAFLSPAQ